MEGDRAASGNVRPRARGFPLRRLYSRAPVRVHERAHERDGPRYPLVLARAMSAPAETWSRKRRWARRASLYVLGLYTASLLIYPVFYPDDQALAFLTQQGIAHAQSLLREHTAVRPNHSAWCGMAPVERCNHTLVVVVGSLRGGEKAWTSLVRHVLAPNRADLALMLSVPRDHQRHLNISSTLKMRAKYIWHVPQPAPDWAAALDKISQRETGRVTDWRRVALANAKNCFMGPLKLNGTRCLCSGAIQYTMRYWLKHRMRTLQLHSRYGRFVFTRSDHLYACDEDLHTLAPQYVWVPKGEDARGGLCDRHVVCSSRHVYACLALIDDLIRQPARYANWRGNQEMWWRLRLWEVGLLPYLRRSPRVQFMVGVATDDSTWAHPSKEAEPLFHTHIKWPAEYVDARRTCALCVSPKTNAVTSPPSVGTTAASGEATAAHGLRSSNASDKKHTRPRRTTAAVITGTPGSFCAACPAGARLDVFSEQCVQDSQVRSMSLKEAWLEWRAAVLVGVPALCALAWLVCECL